MASRLVATVILLALLKFEFVEFVSSKCEV